MKTTIVHPAAHADAAMLFPIAHSLVPCLADERTADIVEGLNCRAPEEAARLIAGLPQDRAVEVLDHTGLEHGAEILLALPEERVAPLLAGMSADRAADLLGALEEDQRDSLLACLDPAIRTDLERLLAYPDDSAGAMMTTEFVSVPASWSVARTLQHIRQVERTRETVYAVYVLDPATQGLMRAVSLRGLVSADPDANVLDAAPPRRPVTIRATAPRDEAVRLISKYDLLAVPVVDAREQVIGIVTVDDVIDTMVQRQTEQVQRFGGMDALDEPYMGIPFWQMVRKRAGWLCALFLSEMLTASAMQGFEGELEKAVVLTLFIPLIMSSGGNSGSQATSLLIRALALGQVQVRDWWRVALRELPAGITLGAILGLVGMTRILLWQETGLYNYGDHWLLVAATVGATLVGIVTFGSMVGAMLPFLLRRIGFDPATASAPFVATLVDVTGLVIYFSIALVILRGTLL
ncbi:magnesium transporter [Oleisolibacter albus]|uniref:magnesium transporter n=1 Tax=Oleisolibacter albus TaxID=2171757 RepID=UPI001EFE5F4D|nr:magnesium transporter [Oleisolibacter albus]